MNNTKKGFTLVEIIVSFTILSIVTVSVVSGIIFSIKNINLSLELAKSVQAAQYISDILITELHDKYGNLASVETDTDAKNVANDSFVYDASHPRQFYLKDVNDSLTGIKGYEVTVVVFYNSGKNSVKVKAFANTGG